MEEYTVNTPDGKVISMKEYMTTEHYYKMLEVGITNFLTNEKQKELKTLFTKKN